MPHHYVLEPNKPSKIRVVFDAAAKHNNILLNEKLLKGPDLLNSLIGLLMRFRKDEYAVMEDIEKNVSPDICFRERQTHNVFHGEINQQTKYVTILRTFTCLVKSTHSALRVGH